MGRRKWEERLGAWLSSKSISLETYGREMEQVPEHLTKDGGFWGKRKHLDMEVPEIPYDNLSRGGQEHYMCGGAWCHEQERIWGEDGKKGGVSQSREWGHDGVPKKQKKKKWWF